ncbi:hypothetical protein AOQ84DRAFT_287527 [Glonium stellatum]|uniref:Phosphatidylserine decarboxylase n=1 Tax=Glonium stellatum TaxID=574774 RepID=A0A8E2JVK5_9PEZI|nr:hypothetical protein AOQ84DRAFT_287527 [Glonium stellatum]
MLKYWNESLPGASSGASALDQAVAAARDTPIVQMLDDALITNGEGFLRYANELLRWIPHEDQSGKDIYDTLCLFYFVLDQSPLGEQQTPTDPSSFGKDLTFLSSWIVTFAQVMGQWMDNPDSLTKESLNTFEKSPKYRFEECDIPQGGFKTFNEFFYRHLKDGARPIANPTDPNTVVYPADCTFDVAYPVDSQSCITVKNLRWNVRDLLQESQYADKFENGIWMHAFLNTYNYHRQHSPVSGTVKEARVIQGAAYLDVTATASGTLQPIRHLSTELPSSGDSDTVEPFAQDGSGYQFLQTRGLIVIDAGEIGYVAVLPIGMAQVSGIMLSIVPEQKVDKGAEVSYFKFGGSDIVLVFQQKSGLTMASFPQQPASDWSMMGSILTTAHPVLD